MKGGRHRCTLNCCVSISCCDEIRVMVTHEALHVHVVSTDFISPVDFVKVTVGPDAIVTSE